MCMKKEKKGKRETERCREEEGKRHREVSDKKRDKNYIFLYNLHRKYRDHARS